MMDNVRTTNLSTASYYYVVAIAAATPWSETCVLLCLCTSKVMKKIETYELVTLDTRILLMMGQCLSTGVSVLPSHPQ